MSKREFYIVITRSKDGRFTGEAPQLRECYGKGETLDELMQNMRKSIQHCLQDDDLNDNCGFMGFHKIEI